MRLRFAFAVALVGWLWPAAAFADTFEQRDLYSFGQRDPQGGHQPEDPPILGADGALYGTTRIGGAFGRGVVYRFQPNDSSYLVLRHFVGGTDGGSPMGSAFTQAGDGRLYGLALNPRLVLYSLAVDGSDYRLLFTFPPGAEQGGVFGRINWLRAGPDGVLYGIYVTGGSNTPPSTGTVFRIARDGSGFQILGTVLNPSSPLTFGAGGQLFGTTFDTVYRLETNGTGFQTLVTLPLPAFGSTEAEGGVLRASDGLLYGVTNRGGSNGFGMIYRLQENGSGFEVIYSPTMVTDGGRYRAPIFESSDGFLYGAAGEDGFGTQSFLWRIRKDGTGWQVLRRMPFNGRGTNGMVEAPDGFLYSFTTSGPGGHELLRIAKDGSGFALVHTFPTSDGYPVTPITLVRGADQRFYGLTDQDGTAGRGTLFRINADGSGYTLQHDFGTGPAAEQALIPKALCAGPSGLIYGIVRQQGAAGAGMFRFDPKTSALVWLQTFASGIVADSATLLLGSDGLLYGAIDTNLAKTERIFRIATDGSGFALLRTLTSSAPSFTGTTALTEGPDGLLYGATTRNGASPVPLLFRLTKDGSVFLPLHDVNVGANPATNPPVGLLVAPNGRLYGFASEVLFAADADGSNFQTLHTFPATTFSQRLLAGFDGKIYGVLPFGGTVGRGTVFRIAPNGSAYEEVVEFVTDPLMGQAPFGFLITAPDGAFCGLTQGGGQTNHGTIFRVSSPAQLVGIATDSLGFDSQQRFGGAVVGPAGRPIDVLRSDDLQNWTLLQRIPNPETSATFRDPAASTLPARFYWAIAP